MNAFYTDNDSDIRLRLTPDEVARERNPEVLKGWREELEDSADRITSLLDARTYANTIDSDGWRIRTADALAHTKYYARAVNRRLVALGAEPNGHQIFIDAQKAQIADLKAEIEVLKDREGLRRLQIATLDMIKAVFILPEEFKLAQERAAALIEDAAHVVDRRSYATT